MHQMQWVQVALLVICILQISGAADTNLDLIIPGMHRGLLFHGADGKTKLQIKSESYC